jgi:hypothetical protein
MSPFESSVPPEPVDAPEAVIVVDAPVQSDSVGVGAPGGTLRIFSISICAMTVELLDWRFFEFVPIANGIKAAMARTPTSNTTHAIIISISDIPLSLDPAVRFMLVLFIASSIVNRSS